MNREVILQYPLDYNDDLYDGNAYSIIPEKLYNLGNDIYCLFYQDRGKKITFLKKKNNGAFINIPLDNYSKIEEFFDSVNLKSEDILLLDSYIGVGIITTLDNIKNMINIKKQEKSKETKKLFACYDIEDINNFSIYFCNVELASDKALHCFTLAKKVMNSLTYKYLENDIRKIQYNLDKTSIQDMKFSELEFNGQEFVNQNFLIHFIPYKNISLEDYFEIETSIHIDSKIALYGATTDEKRYTLKNSFNI